LRLVFGAGDGERDDNDRDEEETRRRFVCFLTVFRERGGGDGEEETCRFLDRLAVFFVCLLPGRDALRVVLFFTNFMLR